ncbi:MAG: pyruvate ferredoxin oxidoreductase [bacterium]
MGKIVALEGNEAVAEAMRQVNPDVVAAYPITPQTEVVQIFSQFVADGAVDTEFLPAESEHSAMSACIGASASGARVMTATSSAGLALMLEMTYIAGSLRVPIVMAVVNRALSAPINIHCDHSDSMAARDAGWIQLYSENAQEAYDNTIQAVKISETVNLPVMVCYDGFVVSHAIDILEVEEDEAIRKFVGERRQNARFPLLDTDNPTTWGPLDLFDYYFEHKRGQIEAIRNSFDDILKVGEGYGKLTGRKYGFFEKYKLDGAEEAIVVLGSTAGTAKEVVDKLRDQGRKVGLLKLRTFRPFPGKELVGALKHLKRLGVMDRSASFGAEAGPLFAEITSALFKEGITSVKVEPFIYGLGGRDVTMQDIEGVYNALAKPKEEVAVGYVGLRE